ncbi:putative cupin superfamily sugar epimerase [Amorphus suaedae]
MQSLTAEAIIEHLDLLPHPEGGHFRETFRDGAGHQDRAHSTAIYYLLAAGQVSHWHRVDAVEVWHWYAGGPLELIISADGSDSTAHQLGPNLLAGERPQLVVPAHAWQTARPLGEWTLIGCTVAPGFLFEGFELAAPDWRPVTRS